MNRYRYYYYCCCVVYARNGHRVNPDCYHREKKIRNRTRTHTLYPPAIIYFSLLLYIIRTDQQQQLQIHFNRSSRLTDGRLSHVGDDGKNNSFIIQCTRRTIQIILLYCYNKYITVRCLPLHSSPNPTPGEKLKKKYNRVEWKKTRSAVVGLCRARAGLYLYFYIASTILSCFYSGRTRKTTRVFYCRPRIIFIWSSK